MRSLIKHIVASILALFAGVIIAKYRPTVVMVTGSVGKTSTKDAVAAALSPRFFIRASEKSYNSEFGVPFTIFGVHNPWKSFVSWLNVFREAISLIVLPNHYPNLLVLEVGADRPGDLSRILRIVLPDAVVITLLPDIPVHVEAYASPEAVREEEFTPAYALPAGAPLIISAEDPHALTMVRRIAARVSTYGTTKGSNIQLSRIGFYTEKSRVLGMQARVKTPEGEGVLLVKGSVGVTQIFPAAAALATALSLSVSLDDALRGLEAYVPPPGRGRILEGKNDSIIIDESYNASPAAVEEALKTLRAFPGPKRRIAVLGDMLELGRYSVNEHERIGQLARGMADVVIGVGVRARGISGDFSYDDAHTAAKALTEIVSPGDVILIKGSQSVRAERIVEALLASRTDLHKLVRQEREWKRLA
jgi:UDP-N-acetylmuramoyl-tripeptide--D-alanyl-D-alanine ligase